MKYKVCFIIVLAVLSMLTRNGYTQLSGVKTIPGDYPNFLFAITDLNTQGVGAGGVIFNVSAGFTDNAANLILTATGTASNPIVFRKSGAGANPRITATAGISTTLDGIFKIVGSDYVTIDGIDLQENVSNLTATTQMEWGYALLKPDSTNGCRYNTIRNCVITLNKVNVNTAGIYSANHTLVSNTALRIADTSGTNSNNKFLSNTISNVFNGISLTGSNDAAPFLYFDKNNEIGTTNGMPNRIFNFGGGSTGTASGILGVSQQGIKIYNTNINSKGGAWHKNILNGIFLSLANNANIDIFGDTITVADSGTTSLVTAINTSASVFGTDNTLNIYDNVIQDCAYPTATSGGMNHIFVSSNSRNLNVYNNKIINNVYGSTSATATGTLSYINIAGGSSGFEIDSWKIYNNSIANNIKRQSAIGGGGVNGINLSSIVSQAGSFGISVYNNSIENNTWQGSSSANIRAIVQASSVGFKCYDNLIKNITLAGATGASFNGITSSTGTNDSCLIYNNTINGITSVGTSAVSGISSSVSATSKGKINNNIISELNSNGAITGITISSGAITDVNNNKIFALYTSTSTTNGISLTGGTLSSIYNNFISDLRAASSTNVNAVIGINVTAGNTAGIYSNTVYLNAVSTSATSFGTSGINTVITTKLDLRNNIIVNVSIPGPTGGFTAAYRRSADNLNNYSDSSNNNIFYVGTASARKVLFYDGTNADETLIAYQRRVTPRDDFSYTELPPFVNVSSIPYDLHLAAGTPTAAEGEAKLVYDPVNITTDIDGNTRNTASSDIGADEGSFTAGDFAPPLIRYTKLSNTTSTLNRTLSVTITDVNGYQINSPNDPRLYYKKGYSSSYKYTNASSVSGNDYIFTFAHDSLGGVNINDTIYYYVAAQDLNAPNANISSIPSGASGINPPGTNPPAKPNMYIITDAPLSGIYTIGLALFNRVTEKNLIPKTLTKNVLNNKGEETIESYNVLMEGDKEYTSFDKAEITKTDLINVMGLDNAAGVYPTITAALGDLKLRGISDAVTLTLLDTLYSNETLPIVMSDIAGTSASNTITIKPSAGVNSVISSSINNIALFKIIGTNNVIIDGSNNGTNTRNLTFRNNGFSGSVLGIGSVGTTPVENVIVKNCAIINASSNSIAGISVCDSSSLSSNPIVPGYFSNITIQNNTIQKTHTGILINGGNRNGSDVSVINNTMNGIGLTAQIFNTGINIQGVDGLTVSGNEIGNITTTSTGAMLTGISIGSGNINAVIEKNLVYNIGYTGSSSGNGGRGISISSGMPSSNTLIKNNMVHGIRGTGSLFSSGLTNSPVGIYLFGGSLQTGVKIYNNSINLYGNTISSNPDFFSAGIGLDDSTSADIRNNIIANSSTVGTVSTGSGSIGLCIEYPASQLVHLDNNIYWINSVNGLKLIGKIGSNNYSTITDWRVATSKDLNSYNFNPKFISDSNLHISTTDSTPVESNGIVLADVTTDFDSEPRYPNPGYPFHPSFVPTAPDIGADETGNTAPLPVELASFNSLVIKNEVILDWITTSELNNSGFEIERMSVINNQWNKAGFVNGNGTTSEIRKYKFNDKNLQTGRYKYRLKQIDYNGNFEYFNLNNEVEVGIPDKYNLSQNYPNPFNPETKIDYNIPAEVKINLRIYDITGREVANIINNEVQSAGYYTVKINASGLSSGIYFYRLTAGEFVMSKRMLLVK